MKAAKIAVWFPAEETEVAVMVDKEDLPLFQNKTIFIKKSRESESTYVMMREKSGTSQYAHRVILDSHNSLDYSRNVLHKDKNSFNLTKKNLVQIQ